MLDLVVQRLFCQMLCKCVVLVFIVCVVLRIQEHKLLRNQSTVGSKLPDLSEAAEQERGNSFPSCPCKTESAFSAAFKGGPFLNLRENLLQSANDDDLLVFFPRCHPFAGKLITEK